MEPLEIQSPAFALDSMLELPADLRKNELLRAMEPHILQTGSLMGRYRPENNS